MAKYYKLTVSDSFSETPEIEPSGELRNLAAVIIPVVDDS